MEEVNDIRDNSADRVRDSELDEASSFFIRGTGSEAVRDEGQAIRADEASFGSDKEEGEDEARMFTEGDILSTDISIKEAEMVRGRTTEGDDHFMDDF